LSVKMNGSGRRYLATDRVAGISVAGRLALRCRRKERAALRRTLRVEVEHSVEHAHSMACRARMISSSQCFCRYSTNQYSRGIMYAVGSPSASRRPKYETSLACSSCFIARYPLGQGRAISARLCKSSLAYIPVVLSARCPNTSAISLKVAP